MLTTVAELPPISLEEILGFAELQTRMDRKYILDPAVAAKVITERASMLQILQIDELRDFAYESVYFDTPELESFRSSAHGRRNRFKVRTRSYVDSGLCVLEVKTAGGRGHTVKERIDYTLEDRARLAGPAQAFLADRDLPVDRLSPTLITRYRRATLLDQDGSRATLDTGLVCLSPDGEYVSMADQVLMETKSVGTATVLDRLLWARGVRPERVSKYCTGLAALKPDLPANKWNRTLRRHFEWTPTHSVPA